MKCLNSLIVLITLDMSFSIVVSFSKSHGSLSVARDDLHTIDFFQLVAVAKLDVVEHERPDVVAEPVRVQLLCLETDFDLDSSGKGIVDGFVKLKLKMNQISLYLH